MFSASLIRLERNGSAKWITCELYAQKMKPT